MAYVEVEVDLSDFDLDEILEEMDTRYNSFRRKKENREKIKKFFIDAEIFEQKSQSNISLVDKMKIDFLMNNLNKISINNLESLIQ